MQFITKIILIVCLAAPMLTHALPAGPIVGLQLGETNTHIKPSKSGLSSADIRNFSLNGRFFIGSQVTSIFGYELGYLRIRKVRVLNINQSNESGVIKKHSLDAVARVNWRFAPDLDLIGRFGASYLIASPNGTVRKFSINDYRKRHVAHYRPLLGIALSYKGAFPLGIEASWIHLLEHRALAPLDFVAVGVTFYTNGL